VTQLEDRHRSIYLEGVRVDLETRAGVDARISGTSLARCVQTALRASGAPRPASVTIVLSDDGELSELNREHMGIDGPTDVLSFPMLPPEAFPRRPRKTPLKSGAARTHVGDIAISVERAVEQADEGRGGQTGDVRWSAAHELRLLVTHGSLHLCGWDHAEPAEEAAMRELEQRLLA
jgi:probable rRNA maturation factor